MRIASRSGSCWYSSLSKDFHLGSAVTLQWRADVINVFDSDNLSSYSVNWGSGGVYDPSVTANKYGQQYTPPRTFFTSLRLYW